MSFFHSKENLPIHKQVLKMTFKGLEIESPHIFNIQILISSWPWALFGSKLLIIWRMSSFVKWQEDNMLSVRNRNSEGKMLPFEIGKHWSAKNWKSHSFLESEQYIYHHEIEEKCREFSFGLTMFSRVTSSTTSIWITQSLSNFVNVVLFCSLNTLI